MNVDHTQQQSADEQRKSVSLSKEASRPPLVVPGYELRRQLGVGAYGEVWVAIDQTTGRQVAIKFYTHRGGLDWSLLSREVEKLAFLSADRYVVQLLDVGWEADPPYYVMEYVERGSLEALLKREGRLPPAEAVTLFREIAVGLLHAHAKGVLHCDLKPANVLLDQDNKPRIADFGQSRLSHEQTPALGTLFYMAPEQADLKAVPDVRWDVYALGALLYAMLTGAPPYRSDLTIAEMETATDLDERLTRYRELIAKSPPPDGHHKLPGVDRALADLIDACLAVDRNQRFANVQAVLDALDARSRRRARWPLVMLGAVGPAIALVLMSLFTWNAFDSVVKQSDYALREQVLEGNRYAAEFAADKVANELDRRYRTLESFAVSRRFQEYLTAVLADPELAVIREKLSDPKLSDSERDVVLAQFMDNPKRLELQGRLDQLQQDPSRPLAGSWFVTDPNGLQLARAPQSSSIGKNYGWRDYFHGERGDKLTGWRPGPEDHIRRTHLSAVYRSESTSRWTVAIATPVYQDDDEAHFMGVVGMSIEVGRFVELAPGRDQYSVLVDWRPGQHQGLVLQHPLFTQLLKAKGKFPDRFREIRLKAEDLPDGERRVDYVDPFASEEGGEEFDDRWLAEMAPVEGRDGNTQWILIVQSRYQSAIGETLNGLKRSLWINGLLTVGVVAAVSSIMWTVVVLALGQPKHAKLAASTPDSEVTHG